MLLVIWLYLFWVMLLCELVVCEQSSSIDGTLVVDLCV